MRLISLSIETQTGDRDVRVMSWIHRLLTGAPPHKCEEVQCSELEESRHNERQKNQERERIQRMRDEMAVITHLQDENH